MIALKDRQPPTVIINDNTTAQGIINYTVKKTKSRAMDMRYYWLHERIKQGHILIYCRPGMENYGYYFTKNHPTVHHRKTRPVYLTRK